MAVELYEHQKQALKFIKDAEEGKYGMSKSYLLADEMGLGKTHPVVISFFRTQRRGHTLLVVPKNAVNMWRRTITEITAEEDREIPIYFIETSSEMPPEEEDEEAIFIFTYNMVQIVHSRKNTGRCYSLYKLLYEKKWMRVVFDEIHQIRTSTTKTHEACLGLKGELYGGVTATPLQKNTQDLRSIANVLRIGNNSQLLSGHLMKRTMEQVARTNNKFRLVELNQVVVSEPFQTDVERALYRAELVQMDRDTTQNKSFTIASFNRLRMMSIAACCVGGDRENMFGVVSTPKDSGSTKMKMLVNTLKKNRKDDYIVFSEWVSALKVARKALNEAGMTHNAIIVGNTPTTVMENIVRNLVESKPVRGPRVLLASLAAYYYAVNLQMFNHVVFLGPDLIHTRTEQAIGRSRRIGQTRPVTATHLIIKNSIEVRVLEISHKKRDLAHMIFNNGANVSVFRELMLKGTLEKFDEEEEEDTRMTQEKEETRAILTKCFGELHPVSEIKVAEAYHCISMDDFDNPELEIGLPFPVIAVPKDREVGTGEKPPLASNKYDLLFETQSKRMCLFRAKDKDEFLQKIHTVAGMKGIEDPRLSCGRIFDVANALRSHLAGEIIEDVRAAKVFCWGVMFDDKSILAFWPLKLFKKI